MKSGETLMEVRSDSDVQIDRLSWKLALRDEPNAELRRRNRRVFRDHERRWLLMTAGRWPWKSESAKECVTTHLPKQLALKMDGAGASCLYSAVGGTVGPAVARGGRSRQAPTSRMARRCASKGRSRDRLEPPSVQILVPLSKSQSILSPGRDPRTTGEGVFESPMGREGIRSVFRNPTRNRSLVFGALLSRPGNRNELEEAAGGPGRPGDRDASAKSTARCGGVRDPHADLENSREGHAESSRRFVPISAAGLRGKSAKPIRNFGIRIGSEERGGSGSGRRRSVGGAGDTPAVARAPGLRTGSLEAVAGPSPSADRGTTELRSLVASRPAVRLGVGSPSPGGPAAAASAA
ncbi:hypothetical protein QTP88_030106 [Uroleucon formosanum]